MKRTSAGTLVALALLGGGAGYLLDHVLTMSGRPTFTPSVLLPVLLLLVGVTAVVLAWPVRRSVRGGRRVDPFRAVRVVSLARASSLLGALLTGFGGGLIIFLLSRPVVPQVGSMVTLIAVAASALVLMAAALVAEHLCTLPKDPDDRQPDDPSSGADAAG